MADLKVSTLPSISFSDGLAIGAIVLTIVLLVLDKAGKLKGPILFWLLALAALMTLPLVLSNGWVFRSPNGAVKAFRTVFLICGVGAGYAALAAWIANGDSSDTEAKAPPPSTQGGGVPADARLGHSQATGTTSESDSGPGPGGQSPIEKLSLLGWTVKPEKGSMQFEVANRALPEMRESATHFRQLKNPFNLHFQGVKSIDGLRWLDGISGLTKIEINAGEFVDVSDLRGLSGLTSLIISQTPISGLATVDISPLASLTNLDELNLGMSKVTDLAPLSSLTRLTALNLIDSPARDLSPLAALSAMKSLDIRGSRATDLSALASMKNLRELGIDGKQATDVGKLSQIRSLTILRIIDQGTVDLSAVATLPNLESVFVWGPARFNLAPLRRLPRLKQLTIQGLSMSSVSTITDVAAIGDLRTLNKLTLGSVNVGDLSFIRDLRQLNELNLGMMPVTSIEALRSLPSLNSLSLNRILVVDISPLLDLPALTTLSVVGTPARADVITELEKRGVRVQR